MASKEYCTTNCKTPRTKRDYIEVNPEEIKDVTLIMLDDLNGKGYIQGYEGETGRTARTRVAIKLSQPNSTSTQVTK